MPIIAEFTKQKTELIAKWDNRIAYIFLDKNILVIRKKDDSGYKLQEPLILTDEYGLMIWLVNSQAWMPAREEIQRVYFDYIAEQEILGELECSL
jgi:hypothetical protein